MTTPLTPPQLKVIFPAAAIDYLVKVAEELNRNPEAYGLDTPLRRAHFFAQVRQESGVGLKPVSENLNYSPEVLKTMFRTATSRTRRPRKSYDALRRKPSPTRSTATASATATSPAATAGASVAAASSRSPDAPITPPLPSNARGCTLTWTWTSSPTPT